MLQILPASFKKTDGRPRQVTSLSIRSRSFIARHSPVVHAGDVIGISSVFVNKLPTLRYWRLFLLECILSVRSCSIRVA